MGLFGMGFWSFSWVADFLRWCGDAVENADLRPSVKRIGLVMVVTGAVMIMVFATGFMGGLVCATYNKLAGSEIIRVLEVFSDLIKVLAGLALTAVTTGYLGGKKIERGGAPGEDKT